MNKKSADPYQTIYDIVGRIPAGRVATYGQVAALAGRPRHARQVGHALRVLPQDSDVPWYRVINAQGEISRRGDGGAPGWEGFQRHLLEEEGVVFNSSNRVDLERYGWRPKLTILKHR